MDITTLNDRHLYAATVVVIDAEDPTASVELPDRIVRFGPAGWLTVTTGQEDDDPIEMYPFHRVVLVRSLRELSLGDAVR
jgi:hypothetical protein